MKTKNNFMTTKDEIESAESDVMRVLVIEDSDDDYELLIRQIKKDYKNVRSARVETADELVDSMRKDHWELIISDNTLPGFNAKEALKLVRKNNDIVPFIIVSGTIGEEAAVKAMRAGANDYMLKNNTARLLPAIKREVREYKNQLERREIEKKLHRSETNYELLAENVHDLVCLHNPAGKYLWVSPSVEKMLGCSPEELIKKGPYYGLHPDDVAMVRNKGYVSFLNQGLTDAIRFTYRRKTMEGAYIHLETIAKPVFVKQKLTQIVSTSRDITQQMSAYQMLNENRAKLKGVLESLTEGIVLVDDDDNIILSNRSANQMLGLSEYNTQVKDELLSEFNPSRSYPTLLKRKDMPYIRDVHKSMERYNQIVEGGEGDDRRWFSINSVPYFTQGLSEGMVISFQDVTDQIDSQEKINRLASELISLIENANAPIFGIDPEGNITEWNHYTEKVTGFSKKEVAGKKLVDGFILKGYQQELQDLFNYTLEGVNTSNYELPIITKEGVIATILVNFMPRRNYQGNCVGVIAVGQDITELIEYRERLELKVQERTLRLSQALKKEKELVEMRSKFVSIASHEFRTPLSTIQFAADFMDRYHTTISAEVISEKCVKIKEQISHMTHLLDDVLTVGKNQAGAIKVNLKPMEIKPFFTSIFTEVENQMDNTHKIVQVISTDSEVANMDEKLLRNIVINVLTNAIKFSPGKKEINTDVKLHRNTLFVTVRDQGVGISEEDSQKVFEPFERGTNTQSIQGTGLGLSIVKKAVDLLRGTIEMESRVGEGTKVKITIPVKTHEENIDRR